MRDHFTNDDHQKMIQTRQSLSEVLSPVARNIESGIPSFRGLTLFQQDAYHPDSAGSIAQSNSTQINHAEQIFERTNITNRRVDLTISTLGQTFETGSYVLEESRMNPEQHLVAGLIMPEVVGKRAAAVCQLAFTKHHSKPTSEDLRQIKQYWYNVQDLAATHLETLHQYAQHFPNESVSDALQMDIPTTPNTFVINWDMSHSRKQARDNYGKLRYDLTLYGERFLEILGAHNGSYMRSSGDGQFFALEIPSPEYDRLSESSIRRFAKIALYPLLHDLVFAAKNSDMNVPVRFAIDIGRIESTTFSDSSPVLFELADVSAKQPHDRVSLGFGKRAIDILQLTATDIAHFNA